MAILILSKKEKAAELYKEAMLALFTSVEDIRTKGANMQVFRVSNRSLDRCDPDQRVQLWVSTSKRDAYTLFKWEAIIKLSDEAGRSYYGLYEQLAPDLDRLSYLEFTSYRPIADAATAKGMTTNLLHV